MKRMFIVGTDGFLVTTMRVALRYSSEITVFGVRDADASVRRALREARPDIVLLDGSTSAERTRERLADVAEERPDAIVLVLASSVDADALEDLLEAGATVCLSRALTSGQLETLLADAAQHQADAPPAAVRVAPHLAEASRGRGRRRAPGVLPADQPRARDPALRRRGPHQRPHRPRPVGDRADGQVPPVEHLPQARRVQPDRGQPLRAAEQPRRRRGPPRRPRRPRRSCRPPRPRARSTATTTAGGHSAVLGSIAR